MTVGYPNLTVVIYSGDWSFPEKPLFTSPFLPDDVIRTPDLRLAAAGPLHLPEALLRSRRAGAAI